MFDQEAIIERVKALVAPLLAGRRADLVELTYRFEGSRMVLRFLVDTARGITLDELGRLNQAIGALLDERDAIPSAYVLEVSSPGLDRPLKTPLDFERMIGRRIKVSTAVPVAGRRELAGELVNANEEAIQLKLDNGEKTRILLTEVVRAVQDVEI
ncbi:MAG: ribosome maturation factor RimP [Candidatus Omnitrophica bacterium]|nr:ribosome maturation factor RimP [Candidatus Omnitrophota bacterium]